MINLKPLHGCISPYTLVFATIEPTNTLELPELPPKSVSSYHNSLRERIIPLRKILELYYRNPVGSGPRKMLEKGTLVRIKVNQKRGYNKNKCAKIQ